MSEQAVDAIRAGRPVVIPTDTVYGLVAAPFDAAPVERLYALKGRGAHQPTALIAPDVDALLELLPELEGASAKLVRALLPGLLTLVLANPARRFGWLTGGRPETIGVRVPELPAVSADVLTAVGALAATSANVPGGPDPASLDEVPDEIRRGCGALVDGGRVAGTASTVVDLTTDEPRVLREGAVSAAVVLERARAALRAYS